MKRPINQMLEGCCPVVRESVGSAYGGVNTMGQILRGNNHEPVLTEDGLLEMMAFHWPRTEDKPEDSVYVYVCRHCSALYVVHERTE